MIGEDTGEKPLMEEEHHLARNTKRGKEFFDVKAFMKEMMVNFKLLLRIRLLNVNIYKDNIMRSS